MSNPLPNEQEIYQKIKEENIVVHPLIWQLLEHHINNDLYMINLIIGSTVLDDEPMTKDYANKIINHTQAITDFLTTLKKTTKPSSPDDKTAHS